MALRYLVSGGTGNSNSTTNWSASSGGASGASVPSTADDIIIDIASLNAPLIFNANMQVRSITVSDYTGTLTIDNLITLTILGTATNTGFILFSSVFTMTSVGTGRLRCASNTASVQCRINTGSVILDCDFQIGAITSNQQGNIVLQSTITVAKNFFTLSSGAVSVTGAFNINVYGNVTRVQGSAANNIHFTFTSGNIIMNGTTPQNLIFQYLGSNVEFRCQVVFNSTSTITISGTSRYLTLAYSPFLYISGTVICDSTQRLLITGSNFVLSTSGTNIILNWLTLLYNQTAASQTLTLQSDCYVKIIDGDVPIGGNPANITRTIQSNSTGTPRKFVLLPDGSQNTLYRWLSTADIDSTEGQIIWSYNGTNAPARGWRVHNSQIRSVGETNIG
jgi:hypothetical protein